MGYTTFPTQSSNTYSITYQYKNLQETSQFKHIKKRNSKHLQHGEHLQTKMQMIKNDNKTLVKEEENVIVYMISESTKFIFYSILFDKMLTSFILCNLIHSNQEADQPSKVGNGYFPD